MYTGASNTERPSEHIQSEFLFDKDWDDDQSAAVGVGRKGYDESDEGEEEEPEIVPDGGFEYPETGEYVSLERKDGEVVEGTVDFVQHFGFGDAGRIQLEEESHSYRIDPDNSHKPRHVVDWEYAGTETPEAAVADGGVETGDVETIGDMDHTSPDGVQASMERGSEYDPGISVKEESSEDEEYHAAGEQFSMAMSYGTSGEYDPGISVKEEEEDTMHARWGTIP